MFEQKEFWQYVFNTLPEIEEFQDQPAEDNHSDREIRKFLNILMGEESKNVTFLEKAAGMIQKEWDSLTESDPEYQTRMENLLRNSSHLTQEEKEEALLNFFFPEFLFAGGNPDDQIEAIRKRRTLKIRSLNPDPIQNPSEEIIFTSNVLLTVPPEKYYPRLTDQMSERARSVACEEQKFWFDHPSLWGWIHRQTR